MKIGIYIPLYASVCDKYWLILSLPLITQPFQNNQHVRYKGGSCYIDECADHHNPHTAFVSCVKLLVVF